MARAVALAAACSGDSVGAALALTVADGVQVGLKPLVALPREQPPPSASQATTTDKAARRANPTAARRRCGIEWSKGTVDITGTASSVRTLTGLTGAPAKAPTPDNRTHTPTTTATPNQHPVENLPTSAVTMGTYTARPDPARPNPAPLMSTTPVRSLLRHLGLC